MMIMMMMISFLRPLLCTQGRLNEPWKGVVAIENDLRYLNKLLLES